MLNFLTRLRSGALLFIGSTTVLTFSQLVGAIAMVRYVDPASLGLWQSAKLAQVYSVFILGGVVNGLSRELPYFLGKGDLASANLLAATSLFYTAIASVTALVCCAVWLFLFRLSDPATVAAAITVSITIACTFIYLHLVVTFRSSRSFQFLSLSQYAQAAFGFLGLPLITFFGYPGMLIRAASVSLIGVIVLWFFRPIRVRPRFSLSAFRSLIKTGVPIFGLDYMKNCAATTDRIALLKLGGVEAVGHYALASTVSTAMASIPAAISQYTYPKMTFDFGKGAAPSALWRRAYRGSIAGFCCSCGIAFIGWLVLPPLVVAFAPAYEVGITAARLILIAAVFENARVLAGVLWSMKVWKLMITYQVVSSLLLALAPFILYFVIDNSITAVAAGLLIGSIVRAGVALAFAYRATRSAQHQGVSLACNDAEGVS